MKRLRPLLIALGCLSLHDGVTLGGDLPGESRPPNVILIMADDLGYRELGCYGQEKIRTPNLDELAADGMRFTQFYSGAAVCAPARCVLMTGKHAGHAAIRGNKEMGGWGPEEPEGQWPLPAEEVTLAELLKDRGYATCAVGKWGLGGPGSVGHPCAQGFDHFYGYLCQRVAHNYYPTHLWRNHDVDVLHDNDFFKAHQRIKEPFADEAEYERFRGGQYAPAEIAQEALEFIDEHQEEPFFLYYASVIPHLALQAPAEWVDSYPREWDEAHYLGNRGYLPTPRSRATYAAMISFLDDIVGRLVQKLDEAGLADNTIIIFTSDNGTTYTGGCDREFFNSLGELRGHKGQLYEGGIRVPMIATWPGHIAPGSESGIAGAGCDLLPTVLELVGGEAPEGVDGISVAPTLVGVGEQEPRDILYWEHPEGGQWQAVLMDGRYKALRKQLRKGDLTVHLYDLDEDPGEERDIAAERPELVERAERLMRDERTVNEDYPIKALDAPAR